jgi:hypothetical protein
MTNSTEATAEEFVRISSSDRGVEFLMPRTKREFSIIQSFADYAIYLEDNMDPNANELIANGYKKALGTLRDAAQHMLLNSP